MSLTKNGTAAMGGGSLIAEIKEGDDVLINQAELTWLSASLSDGSYMSPITVVINPHKECDYVLEVRKNKVHLYEREP